MKVIIYADQTQIDHLKPLLADMGSEAVSGFNDRTAQELLNIDSDALEADLVLVNSKRKDAGIIFNCLQNLKIPVVALVEGHDTDWGQLLHLNVDGYICANWGDGVLLSHLKAVQRRLT
jgi:hypothetical protein